MLRFEQEIPKFSPRYIGHMFSEISLPALFGHLITLLHNPNNISGESSRVGVEIEAESVAALMKMVGFNPAYGAGHFTSGGTIANFEAVLRAQSRLMLWLSAKAESKDTFFETAHRGWRSYDGNKKRTLNLGQLGLYDQQRVLQKAFACAVNEPVLLVPNNMHYSWKKALRFTGLGQKALWPIELDAKGHTSVSDLKSKIEKCRKNNIPILMIVSIAGTTEMGLFDPIDGVASLLKDYRQKEGLHFWHHVDGAYGGFFCSLKRKSRHLSENTKRALIGISKADSITIDPHKLGYVPFASGAFLTAKKRDYYLSQIDAPYLNLSKKDPGPQTIEGSRSAGGAVATWMTLKTIGLGSSGYGKILEKTLENSHLVKAALLREIKNIRIIPTIDSNIVCFCVALRGETISEVNKRSLKIYQTYSPKKNGSFIVSKTELRWKSHKKLLTNFVSTWTADVDIKNLMLIRLCLMNPFLNSKETSTQFIGEFVTSLKELL